MRKDGRRAALVTGAAAGIGEGIARRLVHDGWSVLLMDQSPEVNETAARLGAEHATAPETVVGRVGSVVDERELEEAVADAVERFGGPSASTASLPATSRPRASGAPCAAAPDTRVSPSTTRSCACAARCRSGGTASRRRSAPPSPSISTPPPRYMRAAVERFGRVDGVHLNAAFVGRLSPLVRTLRPTR